MQVNIPEVNLTRWVTIAGRARTELVPITIRGAFSSQAAGWNPERMAVQWPDLKIDYTDDLPSHGVPYFAASRNHQASTTLPNFVDLLRAGRRCYMNQASIAKFPELKAAFDPAPLTCGRVFAFNVWMGGVTRSGMHYDNADNLFVQVYGRKRAVLVSPEESRFLYPFPDNPSKSQVDPENPNLKSFPAFSECGIWRTELGPGDCLFIPRGWWHFLAAEDISISLNLWHGDTLSEMKRIRMFLAGGPTVVWRTAADFVYHGLLRRQHTNRMFSPAPPGVRAFEFLRAKFLRRQ